MFETESEPDVGGQPGRWFIHEMMKDKYCEVVWSLRV